MRKKFSMNVQLFAEPAGGAGGTEPPAAGQQTPPTGQTSPPQIDYSKIQQMLEGTLAAKEDTALKAYFKQQGLKRPSRQWRHLRQRRPRISRMWRR